MSLTKLVKQSIASLGWRLSAPMRRPGCIVLMHHRIGRKGDPFPHLDVDSFRRQLEWLAANCRVIGPEDLRQAAQEPFSVRPPVLITFDDGYRDYHDLAYPVLKELGMPAVVFLATDYIDHPRLLWWDRLQLAVEGATVDHVLLPWQPGRRLALGGARSNRVIRECKQYLKSVDDDVKQRFMDELVLALGASHVVDVERQIMTWDEVRATMDLTTYGGHTHTHPLMTKIDHERLECEIRICRDRILAETGVRPTLFAYPNGDFSDDAKALLPRYGFDVAFAGREGLADRKTDWLEVRRLGVGNIVPTVWMMTKSWI